jgi:hypothetical protein
LVGLDIHVIKTVKDVFIERISQPHRCLATNAFDAEPLHANKRSQWAQNLWQTIGLSMSMMAVIA